MRNYLLNVVAVLVVALPLSAQAADSLMFAGSTPVLSEHIKEAQKNSFDQRSRRQIARILEAEAHVKTVGDAMKIKESGLIYVLDMADFEYLATFTVENPSQAYKNAVANFILAHVGKYLRDSRDIYYLQILESRTYTVQQAMALKELGLSVAYDITHFLDLIQFSVENPSQAFKNSVSTFVANNIGRVLNSRTPIALIIEAERFTLTVSAAMAVKNAGLVAVRTKRDLMHLATYSVERPSAAYETAVNRFIADNISRYP